MSTIIAAVIEPKVQKLLGRCLNFDDLKSCRLVSTSFNKMVIDGTNFKNRAVISITDKRLKSKQVLVPTTSWTAFKIMLIEDCNNYKWLFPLLASATEIDIISETDDEVEELLPPLADVVKSAKNLQVLRVDMQTLIHSFDDNMTPSETVSRVPEAQSVLKNLKEFHILNSKGGGQYMCKMYTYLIFALDGIFKHATNLQAYTVQGKDPSSYFGDCVKVPLVRCFRSCNATLRTLVFEDPEIWSFFKMPKERILDQVSSLDFPELRHIKIVIHYLEEGEAIANLKEFLESHPKLESLELCVTSRVPMDFFEIIGRKLTNLKKLRIVTKGLERSSPDVWNFLENLKQLEDFEFSLHRTDRFPDYFGDFKKLFAALPKTLTKISIKGVGEYSGEEFLIEGLQVMRIDPMQITHLDFGTSGLLADDETLQHVFRHFRMLQYLDISNSICTDDAFTGIGMGQDGASDSGITIKDLKGLKTLKMSHCKDVTDVLCEHAIEFLELVHIDLTKISTISKQGVAKLLEKNPSLQVIAIDLSLNRKEIMEKYPRLREVARSPPVRLDPFTRKRLVDKEELSDSEPNSSDDSD